MSRAPGKDWLLLVTFDGHEHLGIFTLGVPQFWNDAVTLMTQLPPGVRFVHYMHVDDVPEFST